MPLSDVGQEAEHPLLPASSRVHLFKETQTVWGKVTDAIWGHSLVCARRPLFLLETYSQSQLKIYAKNPPPQIIKLCWQGIKMTTNTGVDAGKWGVSVELSIDTATLELNLEAFLKTKYRNTRWPRHTCPGHMPKGFYISLFAYTCSLLLCSQLLGNRNQLRCQLING